MKVNWQKIKQITDKRQAEKEKAILSEYKNSNYALTISFNQFLELKEFKSELGLK